MGNRSSIVRQLEDQMASQNFLLANPNLNGEYIRFSRGGSSKNNCWLRGNEYLLKNGNSFIYCTYGDWKTGEVHTFNSKTGSSSAEIKEVEKRVEECDKKLDEEKIKLQEAAGKKAQYILSRAKPISNHAYMTKKGLKNIPGVMQILKSLTIPMQNVDGELVGLQLISEDGVKIFLRGQKNKGAFFLIGSDRPIEDLKSVYVAEGFATAASIFISERKPVICVFSAGNILPVCKALKDKNKFIRLIICADNDQRTNGNPGVTKASFAAKSFCALLAIPTFPDDDMNLSDFNDMHVKFGISEVQAQLKKASFLKEEIVGAAFLAEDFLLEKKLILKNTPLLRTYKNSFFEYDKTKYRQVSDSDIFARVMAFIQNGSGVKTKATSKLATDLIANLKGIGHLDESTSLPSWLNEPQKSAVKYIPVKNGIINFDKWLSKDSNFLEPHSPHYFSTTCLPISYEADSICEEWINFIEEVQPNPVARKMLQQWFGYNLTTDVSHQKFLIMLGEGANGKSVVCTVLTALLSVENISSVSLEAFNPSKTFSLAFTAGKLANIVSELNSTDKTAEGELKKFVAGDSMTAERKFKDPFSFIPTAKLTFSTNELPKFKDPTLGIWRRVLILPFNVQIPPDRQNKELAKLSYWQSHKNLSGVLNWALEGARDLYESNRFVESEESIRTLAEYRNDSNPTRQFLQDTYEICSGEIASAYALTRDYENFMAAHGHPSLDSIRLAEEVRRGFPGVKYSENARVRPAEELFQIGGPKRGRLWINLRRKPE